MIINCETCGKPFDIKPSRFKKNKHHNCSRECLGKMNSKLQSKKITTNCVNCGKEIKYKKSHFEKTKNHTCSRTCTGEFRKKLYKGDGNPKSLKLTKYEMYFWSRVKTCQLRAKNKDMNCDIDYKYLQKLFEEQSGKCYYSNIDMRIDGKKGFDTASVDRVDSNKGYVKGNVVWCINAVNTMKSNYDMDTVIKIASGLSSTATLIRPLKVKKLRNNSITPTRSHEYDAGYDLYVSTVEDLGDMVKVGFGIALEPDNNTWFMAAERSSLYKTGLSLSNKLGILDIPYRGEIMGVFYKTKLFKELPKVGDRLIQIIPQQQYNLKITEVNELSETKRGIGGFGSSNVKNKTEEQKRS